MGAAAVVVGVAAGAVRDGRATEDTGGREVVALPQLRTWEGYGEDFFYYLSGVE